MQAENLVSKNQIGINQKHEPIVVVCASDDNYAMPLAVTIRSALENLKGDRKITFYVIDGGISDVNKEKILNFSIQKKYEIKFIDIPNSLNEKILETTNKIESNEINIKADYVSIASFYRLIIPELLPKEIEKAIYLDCDLVINGNLENLWQTELFDYYVLAVRDTWIPSISSPTGNLNYAKLGIDPELPYFNAGVLVINVKKWRSENFSDKAITYFIKNLENIGWYDQGLLNILFAGQWGQIDSRWNFNATSFYDYATKNYLPWLSSNSFLNEDDYTNVVNSPYILHYVSDKKPWTSRHCPRSEVFFKYVDMTAWSGWRLNLFRRILIKLNKKFKR